jgi:hypothetical protein
MCAVSMSVSVSVSVSSFGLLKYNLARCAILSDRMEHCFRYEPVWRWILLLVSTWSCLFAPRTKRSMLRLSIPSKIPLLLLQSRRTSNNHWCVNGIEIFPTPFNYLDRWRVVCVWHHVSINRSPPPQSIVLAAKSQSNLSLSLSLSHTNKILLVNNNTTDSAHRTHIGYLLVAVSRFVCRKRFERVGKRCAQQRCS